MSRDGQDVAVVTAVVPEGFTTGVYPVQQGYLVMLRQPHHEVSSLTPQIAHEQHEQLVRILVESGVRVVRARRHTQQAQRWIPEPVGAIA